VAPDTENSGGFALPRLSIAQWLYALAALGVLMALVLSWIDYDFRGQGVALGSTEIPVEFLFDKRIAEANPSILVLLVPSLALLVAAIATKARIPAFIAGAVSVMVAVLYAVQINRMLDALNAEPGGRTTIGLFDFIGIAPYFALFGGVFGLLGVLAWSPTRRPDPADR
jgi:hypothetical protein